jgi:acyl-CoA thioester hydrolase
MRLTPNGIPHLQTTYHGRVRFNDADPLGIVWHGNYIRYFEDGREEFGRKFGLSYLDVHAQGYSTPIVEVICNHKKTLQYGDTFRVVTTIQKTRAAKIIFQYLIFNQNDELVCDGQTIQIFMNGHKELSLLCPDFYNQWKEKVGYEV